MSRDSNQADMTRSYFNWEVSVIIYKW